MNKRKILFVIFYLLLISLFVTYIFYNLSIKTTYGKVMNQILKGETIKSIAIQSYKTPEPDDFVITEPNIIETSKKILPIFC